MAVLHLAGRGGARKGEHADWRVDSWKQHTRKGGGDFPRGLATPTQRVRRGTYTIEYGGPLGLQTLNYDIGARATENFPQKILRSQPGRAHMLEHERPVGCLVS